MNADCSEWEARQFGPARVCPVVASFTCLLSRVTRAVKSRLRGACPPLTPPRRSIFAIWNMQIRRRAAQLARGSFQTFGAGV
eukprot:8324754-Alexandrium_andersonii.AAC.1